MKKIVLICSFVLLVGFALAILPQANASQHFDGFVSNDLLCGYPSPSPTEVVPTEVTPTEVTPTVDECYEDQCVTPTVSPTEELTPTATPSATIVPTTPPSPHGDGLSDGRESGHINAPSVPKAPPRTGRAF